MLLAFIAVFVCVCSSSLQHELTRVPRMPMGPGGGGPMESPRPPMGPMHPPPPVDSNFASNCEMQQMRARHLVCENGSFAAVQCMGPRCFCVDRTTGEKINTETFSMRDRNTVNCSAMSACPTRNCVKVCRDGYRLDSRKCQLCECNAPPDVGKCNTVLEVVEATDCSCDCVVSQEVEIPSTAGPRTRMRLMNERACPVCDESCNQAVARLDTSCAVESEGDCPANTTLKSTGPRGKAECVRDLDEGNECEPEEEETSGQGPVPEGADRRSRAGKVGSSPPPCRKGLVCRETRYREYYCTEEEADAPCVVARATDPYLECDPKGLYKPTQCRPRPEEETTTVAATSSTETITPGATTGVAQTVTETTTTAEVTMAATTLDRATPSAETTTEDTSDNTTLPSRVTRSDSRFARSMSRSRSSSQSSRSRSRGSQSEEVCNCVQLDGTPVSGTEVTISGREQRPDCKRLLRECMVPGVERRGRGPSRFKVRHGQDYFDAANCRTCQCFNGNATYLCRRARLLLFACVLLRHSQPGLGLDIYVTTESGTNDTSCWTGGQDQPCATLSLALEGLQTHNQTTVWVAKGSHDLTQRTPNEEGYQFIWSQDVAIVAWDNTLELESALVTVTCESEVGLSFIYATNVTVRGIEFVGCGGYQLSTSRISSDDPFERFYVAFYFLYAINVTLESIHVTKTPGTGVVMYATSGKNAITSSSFSFNSPEGNSSESGGGGLYIEFPYCAPDLSNAPNCDLNSSTHEKYVSNSEFFIESSIFYNNSATIKDETNSTFILPHMETHLAFGRGGGLSVFFKGLSSKNLIYIRNCTFSNNVALWGGGFFVEYQDMSHNNTFSMENSTVEDNFCLHHDSEEKGTGGGGARIGHIFFDEGHAHHNEMTFLNVSFARNIAYYGGGLSFYTAKEPTEPSPTNDLHFENCKWVQNVARVGSGVDFSQWHPVAYGAITEPSFTDCEFIFNSAQYSSKLGDFVGKGAFYSDSVPVDFYGSILFRSNSETAMVCIGARLSFQPQCTANFFNNTGRDGGAIALMGQAFLEVSTDTTLTFVNNSAELLGGAIFAQSIGEHALISSRNCFVRYSNIKTQPLNWESKFYFENNTANGKLNSIYSTTLLECLWGGAYGLASISEEAKFVFCWNNNHTDPTRWIYKPSGDCSKDISTSPAKFFPVNTTIEDGDIAIEVIPGKSTKLPFYTVDDRNQVVTSSTILTAMIDRSSKSTDKTASIVNASLYISDNSIQLLGTPNKTVHIKLETIAPRVVFKYLEATFSRCPPGMILNDDQCMCGGNYGGAIKCHPTHFYSELQRGNWIGTLPENDSLYLVGGCPYCSQLNSSQTTNLTSHSDLAQLCNSSNRTGVLCGQCIHEYGLSAYGLKCIPCRDSIAVYSWALYSLTNIFPIAIFFVIVVIFNVSATSGAGNSFIFFAQVLPMFDLTGDNTISQGKAGAMLETIYITVYDIWNLNFFQTVLPKYCLGPQVNAQLVISLGYITAFFPLVLVILFSAFVWGYGKGFKPVVCLCTPLHKGFVKFRKLRGLSKLPLDLPRSILHALATFIVLSYTKFTLVSFLLLAEAPLVNDGGHPHTTVFYYDGTVEFRGAEHRPFVIVSILVLLTFVALPPIILVLPSLILLLKKVCRCCFKKDISFSFSSRYFQLFFMFVDQFLNTFHGCYKDGTEKAEGTLLNIDCRWFSGFYFILRLVTFSIFAFTPVWFLQYFFQVLLCVVAMLLIVILRPYKKDLYNIFDALIFANLAILSAISMHNFYHTATGQEVGAAPFVVHYILVYYPLVHMLAFLIWKKCQKGQRGHHQETSEVEVEDTTAEDENYGYGDDGVRDDDLEFSQHVVVGEERRLLQHGGSYGGVSQSVVAINREKREKHSAV